MAKLKFAKRQIDSFHLHTLDLESLFKKCGNPQSLKLVAQPDTHVVHRDYKAVDVFLKFIEWYKPDVHLIMGDFLDAEGITHWPNDELRHRDFIPEVIEGRELLESIVKRTPKCKARIFLEGNHEDWIRQAMAFKLPEFFMGLEKLDLLPDLKSLLDLDKFGYQLIPLNHLLKIGEAHFTHGYYTSSNHPKTHLTRVKGNIYYGHLHDELMTHETGVNGLLEAASLGCLCRLDPKFTKGKPTNWVHGFGLFEFFPDGSYVRYQVRIRDGKISFNGKVFKAE